MSADLTKEALEGYIGTADLYLATSPAWFAYKVGQFLQRTGRPEPRDVRMGRGYQVHANDMLFAFDRFNAITRIK